MQESCRIHRCFYQFLSELMICITSAGSSFQAILVTVCYSWTATSVITVSQPSRIPDSVVQGQVNDLPW